MTKSLISRRLQRNKKYTNSYSDGSNNNTVEVTFPFKDMQVWQKFVVGLKTENRFTLSDETEKFIGLLIEYAKKHKTKTLNKGTSLYRARINDGGANKSPFSIENMGAPPASVAGHGRLNPSKGDTLLIFGFR